MSDLSVNQSELLEKLQSARQVMQDAYSASCKPMPHLDSIKANELWQEFENAEKAMADLKAEIQRKLEFVKL